MVYLGSQQVFFGTPTQRIFLQNPPKIPLCGAAVGVDLVAEQRLSPVGRFFSSETSEAKTSRFGVLDTQAQEVFRSA